MPQAKTTKFYRTFSKGLITEAGYLTYPEDASSDELNTILSRKGNRSRRLGLDFEEDHGLEGLLLDDTKAVNEFVWESVNNDPAVSFVVVQIGSKVRFYRNNEEALSSQLKGFEVDLLNYKIPTASTVELENEYTDMSAGSGFLFLANRYMDPVSVEYVPETDGIIAIPIVIQIRDFEGVYDGLSNETEPSTLSAQHHYNLMNQGWVTPGTSAVDISSPDYSAPPDPSVAPESDAPTTPNGNPAHYDPYTGETTYPLREGPSFGREEV